MQTKGKGSKVLVAICKDRSRLLTFPRGDSPPLKAVYVTSPVREKVFMKPKYSVEQILEAIEASHFSLVVKSVDGEKVEIDLPGQEETVTIVCDTSSLFILHTPARYNTVLEQLVLSSLKTALHILFDK